MLLTGVCRRREVEYVTLCFAKEAQNGHLLHATVLLQPKLALALRKGLNAGFIQRAKTLQGSFVV